MKIIVYKNEVFMEENKKKELIKKYSPSSTIPKNCALAFLFGGAICSIGELLSFLYSYLGADEKLSSTLVCITLIAAAAILTAIGGFDRLAKHAGAGTLVPVTGFSNAVVSEAMDAKSEGLVLGVGSKIFNVAGPVILFGIASGVLYGIIYYACVMIGGLL